MNERLVVDVIFGTESDSFVGKLDEWGDIIVCGNSYIGFGGIKTNFLDKKGGRHSISNIFVGLDDFPKIARALSENEVEIGMTEVEKEPAPSLTAELSELSF